MVIESKGCLNANCSNIKRSERQPPKPSQTKDRFKCIRGHKPRSCLKSAPVTGDNAVATGVTTKVAGRFTDGACFLWLLSAVVIENVISELNSPGGLPPV